MTALPNGRRVALVSMPFALPDQPSIQLGLLAALLRQSGFSTDTHHLNVELAAELGEEYVGLCMFRQQMTGEWLFSRAAFGDKVSADDGAYFSRFPGELKDGDGAEEDKRYLSKLRHELLPAFIDRCASMVDWSQYSVVGFSSTFQQNVASLALARRLKERFPRLTIVFGGTNVAGEMGHELLRAFDFVDHVVNGEGDRALPLLVQKLAAGAPLAGVPGLVTRNADGRVVARDPEETWDLDQLPVPDYHEFFERCDRLGLRGSNEHLFALPVESSRGCWWGRRQPCTFCGQNGPARGFRSKSPQRFLQEVSELAGRHRVLMFQATDNIMDPRFVKDVFGVIARARTDYEFFYEVKSNLTREQLRTLRHGGVSWIQPGIESLSTRVLSLMGKGCTMLDNVRLLKWARYYGMRVSYNLLWGFPGERAEDFEREHDVLMLLGHLEPPNACGRVLLERFAPLHIERARFPTRHLVYEPSYGFAYPDHVDCSKLAYFFEYEFVSRVGDEAHDKTVALVKEWKASWSGRARESLTFLRADDALYIEEGRRHAAHGTHALGGPLATLYLACSDTAMSVSRAAGVLKTEHPDELWTEAQVEEALSMLCARGWMVSDRGRYLGLALPANRNW